MLPGNCREFQGAGHSAGRGRRPRDIGTVAGMMQNDIAAKTTKQKRSRAGIRYCPTPAGTSRSQPAPGRRDRAGLPGDGAAFKPHEEPTRTITLLDRERPVMVENEGERRNAGHLAERRRHRSRAPYGGSGRLSTVEQPVAMRSRRTFRRRSSGAAARRRRETMESERMPRRSTDRIAGDEAGAS